MADPFDTLTQLAEDIHAGMVALANMRYENKGVRNPELARDIALLDADVELARREHSQARLRIESQARGTHVQDLPESAQVEAAQTRIRAVSEKLEQMYEGEAF